MEEVHNKSKLIRLNIGGTTYVCFEKTLTFFPESKLANLDKEADAFYFEQNEYYFDRNPILFAYILDSFRKGAVHLPKDICGTTFKKELEFWKIPAHYVAPCCWEALYGSDDDIETVNDLVRSFQQNSYVNRPSKEKIDFRTKLWIFLDEPKSSRSSMAWAIFISFIILAATMGDSLATLESFQDSYTDREMKLISKFADSLDFSNETLNRLLTIKPKKSLLYSSAIFHTILTLELVLSFAVCRDKKNFVYCFSRVVACFGYMSYWISFTIYLNFLYLNSVQALIVQSVFMYLSIFKIARLFHLTKEVPAFRLICITFGSSKQELKILFFFLGSLVFIFGYILYAAEVLHNSKITNILTAIYWALITLTTVGYGNYVPVTATGHVIAGACAICGVLVLALPIGIIVSKFYKYYDYYRYTKLHTLTIMNDWSLQMNEGGNFSSEKKSDTKGGSELIEIVSV